MIARIAIIALLSLACGPIAADETVDLGKLERLDGFIDLYWEQQGARVYLRVDRLDEPFIYQTSLARGVGSNDIGLDRGQLGATRVVRFVTSGSKVLLLEDNLQYRASSDNADERNAIAESFARSVIWGFEDLDPSEELIVVDATEFFLRDAHGVSAALGGSYSVDNSRSAMYMPRTKAFPDNTEAEAMVTFVGEPGDHYLPSVVPDAGSFTVHIHHSFIRLPDDGYEPLPYDPRAGVIGLRYNNGGFADYATPIGTDLVRDFGRRHRLQKKDPQAALSEAVEPIIYYLDRGAPEPVRSALLDGARWWNQAFEAAGYKDAFQVQMLPDGADPMDVRYNVIQWVHRSTRGWSYGSSILDPRSGEILKGHVTLGSLRVRQDYLIAEGLLAPYTGDEVPAEMLEMSLARIRQLSAHEVGHTLGFEHNFAASTQDRASVMDYPFPLIRIRDDDSLDLSQAYDDKIGPWDKRTVLYAYQDFADDVDADAAREQILRETQEAGFRYVADADSRSVATAHPHGNLWDNGADATAELDHLMRVRRIALNNFSERTVRSRRPLAKIEEALVPIYLLHRFQLQAVGKLLGGQYYNYNLRDDRQALPQVVAVAQQQAALDALLATLDPDVLQLPDALAATIPPRPPNHPKTRESFTGATGTVFDALAPARSSVALTLQVLLDPTRAARLAGGHGPGFVAVTNGLLDASFRQPRSGGTRGLIQRQTNMLVLHGLLTLANDSGATHEVRALALDAIRELADWLPSQRVRVAEWQAHYRYAVAEIARLQDDPSQLQRLVVPVPPGSPIGQGIQ